MAHFLKDQNDTVQNRYGFELAQFRTFSAESALIDRINELWHQVEWDWFTRDGQEVLYWHWSPEFNWEMNHAIRGHNETLIVYVLAASSPAHSIDPAAYHQGYADQEDARDTLAGIVVLFILPVS